MYMLTCDMVPVAKARPRMTRSGHAYTPEKTKQAEYVLKSTMMKWTQGKPEFPLSKTRACHVTIHFYIDRPKSKANTLHVTTRPDLDNYLKLVMDAGNGILWDDDSCITKIITSKSYAVAIPHICIAFDAIF